MLFAAGFGHICLKRKEIRSLRRFRKSGLGNDSGFYSATPELLQLLRGPFFSRPECLRSGEGPPNLMAFAPRTPSGVPGRFPVWKNLCPISF